MTLADRVRTKFVGSAWMFGQVIPMASIWIGSQLGHMKLSPVAAPTRQEDPEPVAGVERPVAVEGEVARLAGDHEPADGQLGADRGEADERMVRVGAGVDVEVRRGQGQERPEVDRELVGVELERLEVAARVEREGRGDGDRAGVGPVA